MEVHNISSCLHLFVDIGPWQQSDGGAAGQLVRKQVVKHPVHSAQLINQQYYQVDTLIKYLVDSLQAYETGHGDALHPVQKGADQSFMGDHIATAHVTAGEVREMTHTITRTVERALSTLTEKIQLVPHLCSQNGGTQGSRMDMPGAGPGGRGPPTRPRAQEVRSTSAPYTLPELQPISTSVLDQVPLEPDCPSVQEGDRPVKLKRARVPPIPGVYIPDLGRKQGAWLRAIEQWENTDPMTNLALKDWPEEWYKGAMREFTGSKRSQRKRVFKEYERCVN